MESKSNFACESWKILLGISFKQALHVMHVIISCLLRHSFFPIVLAMALIEYCIEIASFANTEVSSTDSVDAKYCPKQSNLKPAFSFHFQFWLS